jgi:hypothetical protein
MISEGLREYHYPNGWYFFAWDEFSCLLAVPPQGQLGTAASVRTLPAKHVMEVLCRRDHVHAAVFAKKPGPPNWMGILLGFQWMSPERSALATASDLECTCSFS